MLARNPITVGYGGGVDSTAMLVKMVKLQEPIDLILFADTGGEVPRTYAYVQFFSDWLVSKGYPPIITVHPTNRKKEIINLEKESFRLGTLPSLAFGWHTCSHRFKIVPQQKYINKWQPAIDAWAAGEKVVRVVGFDAGEKSRTFRMTEDPKYVSRFPLQEWGWNREKCKEVIAAECLPDPGKSSCFFCPARKKPEIDLLQKEYPHLMDRALLLEANALNSGKLKKVKGLGRSYSWAEHLNKKKGDN